MKKIKLVIWDLDETFWKGTLSEEGIIKSQKNIDLIIELSKRGIINSIASKNNFEVAKKELENLGVWKYFIFPKITWSPKGKLVKEIIDLCNLRPENVLFLDDNHLNIEEVKFYNEKIHCRYPEFISDILTHDAFKGKNDDSLSRLKQYKILEKKEVVKKSYSNNIEFLKNSKINVDISEPKINDFERIYELIERTNQLNFTKLRSNTKELKEILKNKKIKNLVIRVTDKFGDYGLVGFVSIKDNVCIHFDFSCRVLNLGIEQFIYRHLGNPKINIVQPISSNLNQFSSIDWIKLGLEKNINNKLLIKTDILIKGGCDLLQSGHYLEKHYRLNYELNEIKQTVPVRVEHTSLLSLTEFESNELKKINIPFIKDFHKTDFFNSANIVYSLLMDYDQYLYCYKDFYIPLSYDFETNFNNSISILESRNVKITTKSVKNFLNKLSFYGKMNSEILNRNLIKIHKKFKNTTNLTLIGASSLYSGLSSSESKRIKNLNNTARLFCKKNNYNFLDIDELFNDDSYFRDSYKHYTRKGYEIIAREIDSFYGKVNLKRDYTTDIYLELRHLYRKIRLMLK